MRVNHEIGRVGGTAEQNLEKAILKALEEGILPEWIIGYQMAPPEDDMSGIDKWLRTKDVGDIKVQVKYSPTGAREFAKRHHRSDIAIVIIKNNGMSPEQILGLLIQAVTPLRERYLEMRQSYLTY